jgi:hypothetical protein
LNRSFPVAAWPLQAIDHRSSSFFIHTLSYCAPTGGNSLQNSEKKEAEGYSNQ